MTSTDPVSTAIDSALARAHREVELLALLAAGPRQGMSLLGRIGFGLADLREPDTRTIFVALAEAGRADDGLAPWTPERIAHLCRRLLAAQNLWDCTDSRSVPSGMRWGPGPLARLLTACAYDADVLTAIAHGLLAEGRAAA